MTKDGISSVLSYYRERLLFAITLITWIPAPNSRGRKEFAWPRDPALAIWRVVISRKISQKELMCSICNGHHMISFHIADFQRCNTVVPEGSQNLYSLTPVSLTRWSLSLCRRTYPSNERLNYMLSWRANRTERIDLTIPVFRRDHRLSSYYRQCMPPLN